MVVLSRIVAGMLLIELFTISHAQFLYDVNFFSPDTDPLVEVRSAASSLENLAPSPSQANAMPAKRAFNDPWTNIGPVYDGAIKPGGRTRALIVDPYDSSTLYAGAEGGGVWKSVDGGVTWTALQIGNSIVTCLAYDSKTKAIYAGTGEGFGESDARRGAGIFKSTDAGATWTLLSGTNKRYINKIAVSSNYDNTFYFAAFSGLWYTNDGGATLTLLYSGNFLWVAISSQQGKDHVFAWHAEFGLIQGVDNGVFTAVPQTPAGPYSPLRSVLFYRGTIEVAPSNSSIIYVTQASSSDADAIQGIWKSIDGGVSWSEVLNLNVSSPSGKINSLIFSNPLVSYNNGSEYNCQGQPTEITNVGWHANIIAVHPSNPDIVFVGGVNLFRSIDGGVNFSPISAWNLPFDDYHYLHVDQHCLVFSPNFASDNTLYITNDGGIYKTTQAVTGSALTNICSNSVSIKYTNLNQGYSTFQFYHGSVPKSTTAYLGGAQDNGSWQFKYRDWQQVLGGTGGFTAIDDINSKYYVSYTYMDVYRLVPGSNPVLITGGITTGGQGAFINPYVLDKNDTKIMYIANDILWRTNDATAQTVTWTQLCNIASGFAASAMAIDPTSTFLFIASGTSLLRASLKIAPVTLTPIPFTCSGCSITSFTFHPSNSSVMYLTINSYNLRNRLWISEDSGSNWDPVALPGVPTMLPAWTFFIWPQDTRLMYLGTDVGAYYSEDSGATWTSVVPYGLPNTPVQWFAYQVSSNKLFAFTHGRGVYTTCITGQTPCDVTQTCPCYFEGIKLETNTSLTVYSSNIGCNNSCSALAGTVYCYNGQLSGDCTFKFPNCTNSTNCTCYGAPGGDLQSGQSRTVYNIRNSCWGNCTAGNITCFDGILYGNTTFKYDRCYQRTDCPCYNAPGGSTLYSGESMTVYSQSYGTCSDTCDSYSGTVWCDNGVLSGDLDFDWDYCNDANSCPCYSKWGTLQDGECKTVYSSPSGSCSNPCSNFAGTITCTNGQLSGSTSCQYDYCNNPSTCGCDSAPGGPLQEGGTRQIYSSGSASCGSTCSAISTTITCSGGKIIGQLPGYNFGSCSEATSCACYNAVGGSLDNGNTRTVYKHSSTCDGPCTQGTIKCTNGMLSGDTSYQYVSCKTETCSCSGCACNSAVGGTLNSGLTRPVFLVGSSCDGVCTAGQISCKDGVLSGDTTYKFATCAFDSQCPCTTDCPCTTKFGNTLYSGQSLTVYPNSTSNCTSGSTITCTNGKLSGALNYNSTTCTGCVDPSGEVLANGTSRTVYSQTVCGCGYDCSAYQGTITCINGALQGDTSFPYTTCTSTSCDCDNTVAGYMKDGEERTVYSYASVDCGLSCNDFAGTIRCDAGQVTGSDYKHATCSPACSVNEQTQEEKVASASFIAVSAILIALITFVIMFLH